MTKLKLALTLVLGLSLLGGGAGLAAFKAFPDEPTPIGHESVASALDDNPAPPAKQARVDLFGDPLPQGAIARFGTVRLFHRGPARLSFRSPVSTLLYSGDGKTVFSAGLTETIRCWDVESGKEVRQFVVPQDWMPAGHWLAAGTLALSPDGKTLAATTVHAPLVNGGFPEDHQGLFFLWDVASGKFLRQVQGDQGGSLAFSRDGQVLASTRGQNDNPTRVRLWDVSTGTERRPLSVDCPGTYYIEALSRPSHSGRTGCSQPSMTMASTSGIHSPASNCGISAAHHPPAQDLFPWPSHRMARPWPAATAMG